MMEDQDEQWTKTLQRIRSSIKTTTLIRKWRRARSTRTRKKQPGGFDMNPDTNKFEPLHTEDHTEDTIDEQARRLRDAISGTVKLYRPDGSPAPAHWSVFTIGEHVVIKDYTFRVAYIGETAILFEPVGIPDLGKGE